MRTRSTARSHRHAGRMLRGEAAAHVPTGVQAGCYEEKELLSFLRRAGRTVRGKRTQRTRDTAAELSPTGVAAAQSTGGTPEEGVPPKRSARKFSAGPAAVG